MTTPTTQDPSPPELKLSSRKDKLPKGLLYPLKAGEIVAAVGEPKRRLYLDLTFTRTQAYWKEQRDAIAAAGSFKVLRAHYGTVNVRRAAPHAPWANESFHTAYVIDATIFAVPKDALPPGAPIHSVAAGAVKIALAELAPDGLPVVTERPAWNRAWLLHLDLDANERALQCTMFLLDATSWVPQKVRYPLLPAATRDEDTAD